MSDTSGESAGVIFRWMLWVHREAGGGEFEIWLKFLNVLRGQNQTKMRCWREIDVGNVSSDIDLVEIH